MTLQIKSGKELETLVVKKNGNITCTCLHNLFHKGRDINSNCSHAKKLREDLKSGDLRKYIIIKK